VTIETTASRAAALRLVTAALAFLDSDAAFGPVDRRTEAAKGRLRALVEELVIPDALGDVPQLRVLHGRADPA
jgi:hypothetical protein